MDDLTLFETADHLTVRNAEQRVVEGRLIPYGETATVQGRGERVMPGAIGTVSPDDVVFRYQHDEVIGRGLSIVERDDGVYGSFRVATTATGNDVLALASEGVIRGLSVGFVPQESQVAADGAIEHLRIDLREVSAVTWPAYRGAQIAAVRHDEGNQPEMDTNETPTDAADVVETVEENPTPQIRGIDPQVEGLTQAVADLRAQLAITSAVPEVRTDNEIAAGLGQWAHTAMRALDGDPAAALELRAVADNTVAGNPGVVPPQYLQTVIAVIDARRYFMGSVRTLPDDGSGMALNVPRVTQKPTVGLQSAEKTELSSQAVTTDLLTESLLTYGGVGDLSLQLLRRSSPAFLALYTELLAEAYAAVTDAAAIAKLLADTGINDGGTIDPADFTAWRGLSFYNTFTGVKRNPDTIWLAPDVALSLLDAADNTGRPILPAVNVQNGLGTASLGGGISNPFDGLNPIVVPDMTPQKMVIGWADGFGYVEDGTYQLSVDVPAKAGQDVALVGMVAFAVMYPAAFTVFTSSVAVPVAMAAASKAKK